MVSAHYRLGTLLIVTTLSLLLDESPKEQDTAIYTGKEDNSLSTKKKKKKWNSNAINITVAYKVVISTKCNN